MHLVNYDVNSIHKLINIAYFKECDSVCVCVCVCVCVPRAYAAWPTRGVAPFISMRCIHVYICGVKVNQAGVMYFSHVPDHEVCVCLWCHAHSLVTFFTE